MVKQGGEAERRQFGRRWSQVQGWISIDGRPRVACQVQNLSEGGAQLAVGAGIKMPGHFVLIIEALKMKVACQKVRDVEGVLGVRFITDAELQKAQELAKSPPTTYEMLLAEASADHKLQQQREEEMNVPAFVRRAANG